MINILRCKPVLFVILSLSFSLECGPVQGDDSRRLVSEELLKEAGLEIVWDTQLPLKQGENLKKLQILNGRLYALTDRNYMVSFNRENGKIVFSRAIAEAGFPLPVLGLSDDEILTIIGNKLVEINPDSGLELSSKHLEFGAACPPARNSSFFYVGGTDRRLHTLRAENKVQVFEVAAESDSLITTIIADESFVVFGTEAGDVISFRADEPKQLWSFTADDTIISPMVRDGWSLFFASEDTSVYRINLFTGKLLWKYPVAAVLDKAPRVTADVVYQYVRNKGLAAIDTESGRGLWLVEKGAEILAQADGKAYIITKTGTLVVMDNEKPEHLYTVNFAGVSRYAANVTDSKMYIADETGRIACLKPFK